MKKDPANFVMMNFIMTSSEKKNFISTLRITNLVTLSFVIIKFESTNLIITNFIIANFEIMNFVISNKIAK